MDKVRALLGVVGQRIKDYSKGRFFWIVIAAFFFVLVALFTFSDSYEQFEQRLYDIRFRVKPATPQWDYLSFLDIDDASIANAGEFPWPRSHYAKGMSVLKEMGARAMVFDIQFIDPSPRIVNHDQMEKLKARIAGKGRITSEEIDAAVVNNDAVIVKAIREYPKTVIPYSFSKEILFDDESVEGKLHKKAYDNFVKKASIPLPEKNKTAFNDCIEKERSSIQIPIPEVVDVSRLFGYVDSDFDSDGSARKVRLIRVFDGRIYFSLALSVIADLCNVKLEDIEIVPGKHIILKGAFNPVRLEKKDLVIPVDNKCQAFINWAGGFDQTFIHVPFYALLEYDSVKDDIHQWFDVKEVETKNTRRTALYGERTSLYEKFDAEIDPAKKREVQSAIVKVNSEINSIEDSFIAPLIKERDLLREEAVSSQDQKLKDELAKKENFLTAAALVRKVDNLKDQVCIVGLIAVATQDLGVTPIATDYPMVGSYPNMINTILQGEFITRTSKWINILIFFVFSFGISFLIYRQSAKLSILFVASSIVISNLIIIALFSIFGLWVEQLGVNLAIVLPSIAIVGVKFLSEESQKRFIKQAFGYYLSKQVIDEIIKNPDSLQLGGEEREITIFFSDVRGFTAISEKLTATELVELLNEYLSEMTDIILSNNGTVDKFIGDAIMAFYGAPHHFDNHAQAACLAAVQMQTVLKDLRKRWKKKGVDEIYARFGINTGPAVIGNMGSRNKMNYTAMGDSVNLASRLEGANKYYGTFSMISETTYAQVKNDVEVRYLDRIRVVGKEQPIEIYELISLKGGLTASQKEIREIYNQGIELFQVRDWEKARAHFKSALKLKRDDGPSAAYVDRCSEYILKPPSKKWDGVYKLSAK